MPVTSDQLSSGKVAAEKCLETLGDILKQLDEIEAVMTDMLEQQQAVEVIYPGKSRSAILMTTID